METEITITLISVFGIAMLAIFRAILKQSTAYAQQGKDFAELLRNQGIEHARHYTRLTRDHDKLATSISDINTRLDSIDKSINRIDTTLNGIQQHLYATPQPATAEPAD